MVPGVIGYIPEYRGVTGTPRGVYWAYWALVGEEEGWQGRPRAPSPLSPNRTRKRGRRPPFLFSPSPFLLQQGKRGSPTPGGSRTPPGAPLGPAAPPPLPPLYTEARGHPMTHKLILVIIP